MRAYSLCVVLMLHWVVVWRRHTARSSKVRMLTLVVHLLVLVLF